MSPPSAPSASEASVEWIADLTLEYEGAIAAALVADERSCVLRISNLTAFKSLRPALAGWKGAPSGDRWERLARVLPECLAIHLHGIPIGSFRPLSPLNWEAKLAGVPFGELAIDKLALIRASLKRE